MYRGTLCGLILLLGCPPAAESSVVYLFRHCIRSCDTSGLQAYASQPWAYVKKYPSLLETAAARVSWRVSLPPISLTYVYLNGAYTLHLMLTGAIHMTSHIEGHGMYGSMII